MSNFKNNDYAVNIHNEGIVYRCVKGTKVITLDDYLKENPTKTKTDFMEWKALSDNDYYEQDRRDYRQTWKNTSYDTLCETETVGFSVPSAEDEALKLKNFELVYAKRISFATLALNKLTEVQRRRYVMYHAHGKSYREIAEVEKVHFTTVEESILSAEKRIQKLLLKHG